MTICAPAKQLTSERRVLIHPDGLFMTTASSDDKL
jgi:hypothetical protein